MRYRIIEKHTGKIIFEGTAIECAQFLDYRDVGLFLTAKKYFTCKHYIEEITDPNIKS